MRVVWVGWLELVVALTHSFMVDARDRVFLLTPPSIFSAPPKNLKISKIPFDHLKKRTDITPQKYFRMSTSGSQNIWLPEVKNHHRKSTSGNQKSSPEVDFRKSKIITESRLPEVKNHHRKSTSGSKKNYGSRLP